MCLKSLQCVLLWPRLHFIFHGITGSQKRTFHSLNHWINIINSGSVNSKKSSNKSRGSYRGSTNSFNQQKWCLTFKFPRLPTMFPPRKGLERLRFASFWAAKRVKQLGQNDEDLSPWLCLILKTQLIPRLGRFSICIYGLNTYTNKYTYTHSNSHTYPCTYMSWVFVPDWSDFWRYHATYFW